MFPVHPPAKLAQDSALPSPIQVLTNPTLFWTIRSVPLPHSNFVGADEELIATALGHVANVVCLIAKYHNVSSQSPIPGTTPRMFGTSIVISVFLPCLTSSCRSSSVVRRSESRRGGKKLFCPCGLRWL